MCEQQVQGPEIEGWGGGVADVPEPEWRSDLSWACDSTQRNNRRNASERLRTREEQLFGQTQNDEMCDGQSHK